MNNPTVKSVLAAAACLFATPSLYASVIHSIGLNDNAAEAPSAGEVITSWASVGVDGSSTSYTSGVLNGTVDGEPFSYTVTLTSTGATPALALNNGRLGDGGTFSTGNGATISVTLLTGEVRFDGFRSFAVSSAGDTEGGLVNGTSYLKTTNGINGAGYFGLGGSLEALEANFVHTSIGSTNLRWVDFQFSFDGVIPDPVTPTNVTVTAGNGENLISWDDPQQGGLLEYRILRSTQPNGPYEQIGISETTSFLDFSAENGSTYYYVVTMVNRDGVVSVTSSEVNATPSVDLQLSPPNFLFIIVDDMATHSLQSYRNVEPQETYPDGSKYVMQTPNIDRLANEGMLFHQARIMGSSRGAVCTGSRFAIMTGVNTWNYDHGGGALPGRPAASLTMPGIFNRGVRTGQDDQPYATYRTCKNGNSYGTANGEFTIRNDASKRGNSSGSPDGTGSEWHADRGIEHIEHWRSNHRADLKPFLMYLGFSHPHDARWVREAPNFDLNGADLTEKYNLVNANPEEIVLNSNTPPLPPSHLPVSEIDGVPTNFPFHPFNNGHLGVRDEQSAQGVQKYRTAAVIRNELAREAALMDWLDQQLGRVYAKLEDPNGDGDTSDSVMDNTYIVFTSDHGIAVGRHGLMGKQSMYDHSWRVPYLVRGPGIEAGSRSNALVYLHDTFPTFMDIAGLDSPSSINEDDGKSFKSVLFGEEETHREQLYGIYSGGSKPGIRAVTDGRFKLIKYDVDNDGTEVTQLFDMQENPFELLPAHGVPNLAEVPAYTRVRQRMERLLMEERIRFHDPYKYLGDKSLWSFEEGVVGEAALTTLDSMPFKNGGTAGAGSFAPVYSSNVASNRDFVSGEANTLSLDFEQDLQSHITVADASSLDFGAAAFTIQAWVKLETLPSGTNLPSVMPVVTKKNTADTDDSALDYMFLAAAGSYGNALNYGNLALRLGATTVVSNLGISDTDWHFIAVAYDPVGDVVRFTLDDQEHTLSSSANGTANAGLLTIGAFHNAGTITAAFDGLMDEVCITNGFLSSAELQPYSVVSAYEPFKVTGFQRDNSGNSVAISFESSSEEIYTIQKSNSLLSDSWEDVRSFFPGEEGETAVETLSSDPAAEQEFFRVIRE